MAQSAARLILDKAAKSFCLVKARNRPITLPGGEFHALPGVGDTLAFPRNVTT